MVTFIWTCCGYAPVTLAMLCSYVYTKLYNRGYRFYVGATCGFCLHFYVIIDKKMSTIKIGAMMKLINKIIEIDIFDYKTVIFISFTILFWLHSIQKMEKEVQKRDYFELIDRFPHIWLNITTSFIDIFNKMQNSCIFPKQKVTKTWVYRIFIVKRSLFLWLMFLNGQYQYF